MKGTGDGMNAEWDPRVQKSPHSGTDVWQWGIGGYSAKKEIIKIVVIQLNGSNHGHSAA